MENLQTLLSSIRANPIVKIKRNMVADCGAYYLQNKNSKRARVAKTCSGSCYICKDEFTFNIPSPKEKQEQARLKQVLWKELSRNQVDDRKKKICSKCLEGIKEIDKLRRKMDKIEIQIGAIVDLIKNKIADKEGGYNIDEEVKVELIEDTGICDIDCIFPIIEPDSNIEREESMEEPCSDKNTFTEIIVTTINEETTESTSLENEQNKTQQENDSDLDYNVSDDENNLDDDADNSVAKTKSRPSKPSSKSSICHLCGKSFATAKSMGIHIKEIHERIKDHKCTICSYSSSRARALRLHMKTHQSSEEKIKVEACKICHLCGKSFTTTKSMEIHIKGIHEGIKDHKCTICSYSCSRARRLRVHMKKHQSSEEKRKCETCDESFPSIREKLVHQRSVHLKKDIFSCESCPFVTTALHRLDIHKIQTHPEKTAFPCTNENCEQSFESMKRLVMHQVRVCFVPGVSAEEREKMKMRMRQKKIKKWQCPYCEKEFCKNSSLELHLRTKHSTPKEIESK